MPEFRLKPEDWPRLEALKGEQVYIDHDTPDEYSNAMRCGMVRVILGDFDIRGHHVHAIALTPAGYAMLAERERWRESIAHALMVCGVSNEMALRIAVEMEVSS